MNFERIQTMCQRLVKEKFIDEKTTVIANHISHNGLANYEKATEAGKLIGCMVSFDGLEVEI